MKFPRPWRGRRRSLGRPAPADVGSGLVTGLFSIPEGMAYAAIAGFNPVAGLYAGVVPAIVGSLTSRTVLMVTTLTSALALTSQSVLSDAGLDPKDAGNVATLTLMAGVVMLLMGVLRLGVVMSFVSNAVMTGFSTGIALQIITGVLKDATGYKPEGHNRLHQLGDWLAHIGEWQLAATLVAAATIALWALTRLVRRLEPVALLVAMVVASVAVAVLGTDVELVGGIAHIPAALPGFSAPDLSAVPALLGGAVAVALVGLAQAASIGPSVPNPDGSRSSVNGDFAAQGLANLAGGLFQALPSGGSLSRTGVAVSAGARTRWAGVISGVLLALIVLVCAPLAEHIPMPVIGGLILVVGGELIWGKRHDILLVLRTSRLSSAAMIVTFLATTQLPLQQAIVIGAVLSLLLYCVQAARRSRLVALTADATGRWHPGDVPASLPPGEVTVLFYDGVGFFAELPGIAESLPPTDDACGAVLILVMRGVPDVPSSTMTKVLRRHAHDLRRAGGRLILVGVEPGLARALEAAGLDRDLGPEGIVPAGGALFDPLDQALATARAWITDARSPSRHDPQEGPEQPGRPEPQPPGGP
ncbi:SulP family inorganic anion transporter [Streptomyces sp. BE308]|uniref:SulP family inorganic anion transporter n=1 Tax=Streptomyces sp. BE308 TaxID=3002529 RepID=UPI002E75D7BB|nr:SulP family inorganic anion transporter [Streptomyces sp. BE308]MEE1791516.1 SulP family inorganic anion transporter [Streptomyces sp. BE308]